MGKRTKIHKNSSSHDEFVKNNLSNKIIAQDFMRQFLPADLLKNMNLTDLVLDTNTYITAELAKYYSDIVWLCPYSGKKNIRISLLLEHKSNPVAYPHLQLLRYMLELWEKNQRDKEPFLPIVPIIFYHGKGKWNIRPMTDYFKNIGQELKPYIPQFNYELVNISQYTDKDIFAFNIGLLKNVLLALRYSRDKNYLRQHFGLLFIKLETYIQTPNDLDFIKTMLVYLLKNTEFSTQEITDMVKQIPSPLNNIAMSSYDLLIEKGKKEGMQQGIEKEKIEVIKNARLEGLDIEFIAKLVKLPPTRIRQILDNLGIK
jgi:predicted transposase/invertase (TIGR01784 family)